MIDPTALAEPQQAPIPERIQAMEDILQSLRKDMATATEDKQSQAEPFKVRKFCLRQEVHVDRDAMYAERSR